MRIAYFIARADTIGGSQRHVLDLASAMQSRGHQVQIYTGKRGPFSELVEAEGLTAISIPSLSVSLFSPAADLAAIKCLIDELQKYEPDVLTVHSSKSGLIGRIVAKRLSVACVYTLHGVAFGPSVQRKQRVAALAAELLLRPLADHVIAVSEFDRSQAIKMKVASASRITTIRNGLPFKPPTDQREERPSTGRSVTRIAMVARFSVPKRHDLLIEALARLPQSHPWTLGLVGDGESTDDAVNQARRLDLTDRITFHGLLTDVEPVVQASDLVVLLSDREGLPISIGEALRAGRPVLASAVGGIPEVVSSENGWLVTRGDADSLDRALLEATDPATDLTARGRAARAIYLQELEFESFVSRTMDVYRTAVNHKRRPRKSIGLP